MAITLDQMLNNSIKIGLYEDKANRREYREIVQDGIYSSYSTGLMSIVKKIHSLPKGIVRGLNVPATIEEKFEVHNKIPFDIFLMILNFYTDICEETNFEASVLVYANPENKEIPSEILDNLGDAVLIRDEFVILVPEQVNTPAHSSFVDRQTYDYRETDIAWFHDNLVGVLETHSHNTMTAFWSGEDDKHERYHTKLKMFMVFGTLDKKPTFRLRYVYDKEFTDFLPLDTLFEIPEIKTNKVVTETIQIGDKEFNPTEQVEETFLTVDELLAHPDVAKLVDYPKDAWNSQIVNRLGSRKSYNQLTDEEVENALNHYDERINNKKEFDLDEDDDFYEDDLDFYEDDLDYYEEFESDTEEDDLDYYDEFESGTEEDDHETAIAYDAGVQRVVNFTPTTHPNKVDYPGESIDLTNEEEVSSLREKEFKESRQEKLAKHTDKLHSYRKKRWFSK